MRCPDFSFAYTVLLCYDYYTAHVGTTPAAAAVARASSARPRVYRIQHSNTAVGTIRVSYILVYIVWVSYKVALCCALVVTCHILRWSRSTSSKHHDEICCACSALSQSPCRIICLHTTAAGSTAGQEWPHLYKHHTAVRYSYESWCNGRRNSVRL